MDTSIRRKSCAQPDVRSWTHRTSAATSEITPLKKIAEVIRRQFYVFLAKWIGAPVTLNVAPDGTILGSNVYERLRLVKSA